MSKVKKPEIEIDMVTDLSIKQVGQKLSAIKSKYIDVTFKKLDEERVLFTMNYRRRDAITATVKGILQKKAGRKTHVIADGIATRIQGNPLQWVLDLPTTTKVIVIVLIFLALQLAPVVFPELEAGIARIVTPFSFTGIVIGILAVSHFARNNTAKPAQNASNLKDRDVMLQRVINILSPQKTSEKQQAPMQEAADAALSLQDLANLTAPVENQSSLRDFLNE